MIIFLRWNLVNEWFMCRYNHMGVLKQTNRLGEDMEMQVMTSGMTAHKIMEVITAVGLVMQVS